jgi:Arm DNA-binding domain
MHSKGKTRSRAKFGTVRIKVSNERLQLVFRHGGKRYYLSTGFRDTLLNRKLAQERLRFNATLSTANSIQPAKNTNSAQRFLQLIHL